MRTLWEHIENMKIKETFSGARRSRPLHGMSGFRLEVSAEREWNSSGSYLVEREREREQQRLVGSFFLLQFLDLMMMLASNIFGHFAFQIRLQSRTHTFD